MDRLRKSIELGEVVLLECWLVEQSKEYDSNPVQTAIGFFIDSKRSQSPFSKGIEYMVRVPALSIDQSLSFKFLQGGYRNWSSRDA